MKNFQQIHDLPIYENLLESLNDSLMNCLQTEGQICVNTVPGYEDDFMLGVGSLVNNWKNKKTVIVDGFATTVVPVNDDDRLHDKDFSVLCNAFKGTVFEDIYNELNSRYLLGRVRLFKSEPGTCLTWHEDGCGRLHYPIKTQKGCFMVIDDEIHHMPQNTWTMADTSKYHTAFNGSKEARIHLVAVIRGLQ